MLTAWLGRAAEGKESEGHGYERATAALLSVCICSSLVVAAMAVDWRLGALGLNPELGPAQPGHSSAAGARKPAEGRDVHRESCLGGQSEALGRGARRRGAGGQQVPSPRPSLLRPAAPRAGAVRVLGACRPFPGGCCLAGAAPAASRAVAAPGGARHQPRPCRWRAWPRAAAPSLGSARGSRVGC